MGLLAIPAIFMRGGTSKALIFNIMDLPKAREEWDGIFLAAMGSPDPNGRQLDGMGGGISSLSKVCIVGPPSRDDADIDFTFAQISVDKSQVDYGGNCGNMVSAIGPIGVEMGLVQTGMDDQACVRIYNTNTDKIIKSTFPIENGAATIEGDLSIDGVAGTSSPIKLDFLEPGGAKTNRLLPTGKPMDHLTLYDGKVVTASLIDAANPCVFVEASEVGKIGSEHPDQLAGDTDFLKLMEDIRCSASVKMGIASNLEEAKSIASIPKVAMVSSPAAMHTLAGIEVKPESMSFAVRMLSMGMPHKAVPITGAICLGVAARIEGTIVEKCCESTNEALCISHPSGSVLVDAELEMRSSKPHAVSGTVYRTARKLFAGMVYYRDTPIELK